MDRPNSNSKRAIRAWLAGILLVFAAGCGSDDLPDYFLLDRLRVLGANVVGAAAEFSAGDSGITIAFHVSDPKGAGRSLSYSLEACVDPGIGLGASPTCSGNPTRTVITASGTFTPGSAATNYYGVLTTPAFSVPAAGIVYVDPKSGLTRPAYEQRNGVGYLVMLTLTASATETATAFKRVIVSTKATKNQNPTFASPALLFAGADASTYTLGSDFFSMVANAATGAAENYDVESADGTTTSTVEKLTVTWLSNAGSIRFSRTDPGYENRYTPANPAPTKTSFLAILRDDRGGLAVVDLHK